MSKMSATGPTAAKKRLNKAQGPVLPTTPCRTCHDRQSMVKTDLTHTLATPIGVRQITRLPGAQCRICGATELDPEGLELIEQNKGPEIWADYQTRVSRSGKVPAVLLKEDLRRVLGIEAGDSISWKVIDRDHALVEVHRRGEERA